MPDPKSGKSLTDRQLDLIKKWIEQGAAWKGHWAYITPVRPPVPPVDERVLVKNPIDQFVVARLQEAKLHPSPQAERATLIRRLYFDLLGLPPPYAEVEAFVNHPGPNAYEEMVDHLLSSPHY